MLELFELKQYQNIIKYYQIYIQARVSSTHKDIFQIVKLAEAQLNLQIKRSKEIKTEIDLKEPIIKQENKQYKAQDSTIEISKVSEKSDNKDELDTKINENQ